MIDIFGQYANANITLMAHRALEEELPRGLPGLGKFGCFDMPDTFGSAGIIDDEASLQLCLAHVDEMTEDEVIVIALPEMVDFYLVVYGANPV